MILKNAAKCKTCGVVLESKHVHDYVACACGNAVDGGREYIRRTGKPEDLEELSVYSGNESAGSGRFPVTEE